MNIRWLARSFATAFRVYFRLQLTDGFVLVTIVVQPLVYALLIAYMLRGLTNAVSVTYAVMAGTLMSLWVASLYRGTVTIIHERQAGMLELLVTAPLPFLVPLLANHVASVGLAAMSLVLTYALASAATGGAILIANPPAFLLTFLLGLGAFVALGLWFATATILNPEVRALSGGLEILGYLLGGFAFPAETLPSWLRVASSVFPPYWVSLGLQKASIGQGSWSFAKIWLGILILAAVYGAAALYMLRIVLIRTRQEGTLHAA
jgi:ABC-type multidrug transport system permease subunit